MNGPLSWIILGAVMWITVAPVTMLLLQATRKPPTTLAVVLMAPLLITNRIAENMQSALGRVLARNQRGRE